MIIVNDESDGFWDKVVKKYNDNIIIIKTYKL